MEMCAAAGSTLMMSPGFSLSPYPSLLWGGQSSLHQPRPTAPNRYQPPALSVDTLHMWRGKERKRQEGEMWIRWHHPMWKPSSLQWRHLQTLGSSSSVAAGDPNRRLAALHSTLRSTFSPHLYSMLLNFSFLSSLFFFPYALLVLASPSLHFPPPRPSTSAKNRARHFAKNKDGSVDFFKVFTPESCSRLWLGGVNWKAVIHKLNFMGYNHSYIADKCSPI